MVQLTTEDVARLPLPGMAFPGNLSFSQDGRWIGYLHSPDGDLVRQLFILDAQTGQAKLLLDAQGASEANLSTDEKLRRERQRQYNLGITSFAWSPVADLLLVPLPDGLYLVKRVTGERRLLVSYQDGALLDPQFSPDGHWVSYVQNGELFISGVAGAAPRQLTHGAAQNGKTHGLAEYIAQEEMDRHHGYWWSPDSRKIAFTEVDESHIPGYVITHQGKEATGDDAREEHRYPFAGQANARLRLGVITLDGGEPVWMDLGDEQDIYLARVQWWPDGCLAAQVENRHQDELRLVRFDPLDGAGETVLVETNPVWINLNNLFKPLKDGRFLWGSERSGFQHLYLYGADGRLIHPLTSGDWLVESIAGVDEKEQWVYFTATKDSPLESRLYAASLDGSELHLLTQQAGMHSVTLDITRQRFIDAWDALDQPPTVLLRSLVDGSILHTIYAPNDPRLARLNLQPPEMVAITNRQGVLLHGLLFRPAADFGPGPYPTIVQVYGGPHAQLAVNSWRATTYLRAQYLRDRGFLVFVLDNRGSARRGLAFEGTIRHRLGVVEVQDQVDGVNWLVDQGLADPGRVGIYGWSYGGYMALMCLLRAPETFKVAVSGAPVTAWDGYDTHYTERYMGAPQSNTDGYRESAVLNHVEGMQGRLLLVHGLIDENVHFRHTARLLNALIRARKRYELLLFPDERHGPRRLEDRVYLEERLCDFFQECL
jgi:dipeptidyl-peptidase-4